LAGGFRFGLVAEGDGFLGEAVSVVFDDGSLSTTDAESEVPGAGAIPQIFDAKSGLEPAGSGMP
jgi:hypothetical protein